MTYLSRRKRTQREARRKRLEHAGFRFEEVGGERVWTVQLPTGNIRYDMVYKHEARAITGAEKYIEKVIEMNKHFPVDSGWEEAIKRYKEWTP